MAERILMIDDDSRLAGMVSDYLGGAGFRLTTAGTAREGEALLKREAFDAVILDLMLPDSDGLDVCRRLRESSAIPVLFLTARDEELDRILGLELGGDDYVTKPFSPREIVARVRAILRRASPANHLPSPAPPAGTSADPAAGLHHDPSAMRIHCHGSLLDLTAHEYKLLLVLLEKPGRVFTRDQLLEHAWPDPGAVTDRTVDDHIKYIRAKLRTSRPGAENLIESRRGLGYSLAAIDY